jgi:hypothetical protein
VKSSLLLTIVAGLALAGSAAAHPVAAQPARLTITVPPRGRETMQGPTVITAGVLSNSKLQEFIRSGFPARLHYRVELWSRTRGFDNREANAEWVFIVEYQQLEQTYTLSRQVGNRLIPSGPYKTMAEVQTALAAPFEAPVRAPNLKQRMYYHAVLEIEKISLSDLDELEAWLRGELQPATRGERNPGTALWRGIQTIALRMLGGENPRYEARSDTFGPP